MFVAIFAGPLLMAHVTVHAQSRELHRGDVSIRARAREGRSGVVEEARLEITSHGTKQTIDLGSRDVGVATFLSSIEIVDANFDGHSDVAFVRALGARWHEDDVYLFDARTHKFSNASPLARELSHLSNANFDERAHAITTRELGPQNPARATYAITSSHLQLTNACHFYNPTDVRVGTLVRTSLTAGEMHSTYTKVRLGAADLDPCQP